MLYWIIDRTLDLADYGLDNGSVPIFLAGACLWWITIAALGPLA